MNKKKLGSYYTPDFLASFMLEHILDELGHCEGLAILEPSIGDGSFLRALKTSKLRETATQIFLDAIEKEQAELIKAASLLDDSWDDEISASFYCADFLDYQHQLDKRYDIVVGNPPYIKKSHLTDGQIALCSEIHSLSQLNNTSVKNIWSAFVIRCSQLLEEDGVLAFVLPAELLQVKFSEEIRNFLVRHFERIEIFTFDDLLFECKGQDTVLFFGFKAHEQKGQFYSHIDRVQQLASKTFKLDQNQTLIRTETKWSHHSLSSDELTFLEKLRGSLKCINHYCDAKPGIVTAANSFFIVNEDLEAEFGLSQYARPIIQRGSFVNGNVVFTEEDLQALRLEGKPSKLLCFSDEDISSLPPKVVEYLELGVEQKLPERFKCRARKNWFVVPNISTVPEGFFFKRSHHYPKLLKNDSGALVTDSAYKIYMKDAHVIDDLVFSFYNSLTLTFAELDGRYYGGGVLELTPSEFKKLPVPLVSTADIGFHNYTTFFQTKKTIDDVLDRFDSRILQDSISLNDEEIELIRTIYKKMSSKRLK